MSLSHVYQYNLRNGGRKFQQYGNHLIYAMGLTLLLTVFAEKMIKVHFIYLTLFCERSLMIQSEHEHINCELLVSILGQLYFVNK